jgi:hypothetical protein
MASSTNAAIAALAATALWMLLGYALGRRIFPKVLAIGAAPIAGWAVYNSVTLPFFGLVGFTPLTVAITAGICAIGSCYSIFVQAKYGSTEDAPAIPMWAFIFAAIVALIPASAIMPKVAADSVQLADPIFDHSKIAIIDAMSRLGVPPVNPFFGEGGAPDRLVYYYLWYFSAAQLSLALGISGWEADIGQTWFAAFSSLSLMMGLATLVSRRSSAALWVALLTCGTSLRDFLATLFGGERVDTVLASPTGFAGWLFQAAWVPQHLTSASCVVLATLLLSQYARYQTLLLTAIVALVIVAGFECSTYVGGVTFAIAALLTVPILYFRVDPARRIRFILGLAAAALLVACLAAPFIIAQIATIGQRGTGAPIVIHQFDVLSEAFPYALRRVLDLPSYWLILLPIEFPSAYIAGAIALIVLLRAKQVVTERSTVIACALLAVAGLSVSWLLVGDLGGNNDLGMRAVLPSAMILIAAASVGVVMHPRRILIIVAAVGGLFLSMPHTLQMIHYNFVGNAVAAGRAFSQTPELWAAVRRHTGPDQRVGNNPLFLKEMTPWPVNISWALLANRSSCFAAQELVLAYVAMPRERREAIHAQFVRVFEGQGAPQDVAELARRYGCDFVVVTPQDGAWNNDPFASSANYRLVETRESRWRIYQRVPGN